jgi:CRP-like cAMP-binding protein/Zn-dependent protease
MATVAPEIGEPHGLWRSLVADGAAPGTVKADPALDSAEDRPEATDVWACLADRLDLGAYVPTPSPDVIARAVEGRDGRQLWVLRSPSLNYLRLDDTDLDLWNRMDGRRNVREIALEHFLECGGFVADRLARLVRRLRADGFLGAPPRDAFAQVGAQLQSQTTFAKWAARAGRVLEIDLARVEWADRAFALAYARGGWLLYTRPACLLWAVIIVAGLISWWRQMLSAEHALLQTNGSYTLGLLTLAALDIGGVKVYQIAQALTMKRHNVKITSAGLQLYYLLPLMFVETSDVWMADRRSRMAVSLSGPFSVLVLGGALALLANPLDGTEMGAFLFKASFVWLVNGVFNLLPILELDGYFLLVDYLEMPALRANALAFVREGLWPQVRSRAAFTRDERIYTAYGLGYALLVVLIPLLIFGARDLRYASSFAELWQRPDPGGQLMAVGMGAVLLGPAAFAILAMLGRLILAVVRIALQRWRLARGQVPREHLEALAALPFLAEVARAELRHIASYLRVEDVETGRVIVRQGARGDRFYVLLDGTVRVVRVAADEHVERLATLGPGDYFGEAALVANVPRTATIVAETPAHLLSLDAGHFRRWLASRVDVDAAVHRTLAERQQLARLPLFAGVGSAELDRLAAKMLITRYSAGDTIVEQGAAGDRFFAVVDGRVQVVRTDELGRETVLAELGVGDFFGEMALLDRAPRSATVRALSPVETYTLAADAFHQMLERPMTDQRVREAAHRRLGEQSRGNRRDR